MQFSSKSAPSHPPFYFTCPPGAYEFGDLAFGVTSAEHVSRWRDGGLRNPHSDSLQAKPPFTKDGARFAARKVGVPSTLGYIAMSRALQATPSLLTYSARPPLSSIVEDAAIQPDEPVKLGCVDCCNET